MPPAPAEDAEEDDDPDDRVEAVLVQERSPVVARGEAEEAEPDEGQEDRLEEKADEGLDLGLEDEPVHEEERPDGEEGEQAEHDSDGPVEVRAEAPAPGGPCEVPHVQLRQRTKESPFGHRSESTFRAAPNV